MKFNVNDLVNVSCFCDVYRKSKSEMKAQAEAKNLAETVVAEAKNAETEMSR